MRKFTTNSKRKGYTYVSATLAGLGIWNVTCAYEWRRAGRRPSERDREAEDLGRAIGLEENGAGPSDQVEEEESVVFSNIEVSWAFRAWRSGGDGIYRAHTQRAVLERGRRICPPGKDGSKINV